MQQIIYTSFLKIKAGFLKLKASNDGLSSIKFVDKVDDEVYENEIILNAKQQLQEYFDDERTEFDVPLDLKGTEFQNKVWSLLITIPYGKTISYLDLAKMSGDPKATRAVASANGKNPLPIIVPCHRVIGSDGSLTGYSGGINNKKLLLSLENKIQTLTLFD